ncbi:hypothetical protein [Burkholderia sp. Ac-20365]|uniref:hypothetical protein n=1 Tax=Burkholderia sp. Ac-20365 TaxID=2703897 RepID=UPI00197C3D20|nr:hypothetical protein [Burkholderia sp. Ac-20365]MBN3761136.1 hypothetical protein [Burkholderia sp. Ac-20365]
MRLDIILALLLLASSPIAHAATPLDVLQQQQTKINDAIDARNRFLDKIGFAGHSNDSVELASINGSELTVIYTLQALDDMLRIVEKKSATVRTGLKHVGNSMVMVCQAQLTQIASDGAQLDDSRIRKEIDKQINNVRAACDAIVAVTD